MRLRLPLGWLSSIFIVLLITGALIWLDTLTVPHESTTWHLNPHQVQTMKVFAASLIFGSGFLLLICTVVECSLRLGWEPKGLRKLMSGVYVERKFYITNDFGKERQYILVRLANGRQEEYECDPEEYIGVAEGDCLNLYVIGPYVESYRKIEGERAEAVRANAKRWGRDIEISPYLKAFGTYSVTFRTWIACAGVFFLTSFFLALGLIWAMTGEIFWRSRRRRWSTPYETLIREDWVPAVGVTVIMIVGIVVFIWIRYMQNGIENQLDDDNGGWTNYRVW